MDLDLRLRPSARRIRLDPDLFADAHARERALLPRRRRHGDVYGFARCRRTGAPATSRLAFFGLSNYNANPAGYNSNIFINTPITTDSSGDIFFGFIANAGNTLGLTSGVARIGANGVDTWTPVVAGMSQVATNSAPALSNDGSTLYVLESTGNWGWGKLVALNSQTLTATAQVTLIDPHTGNYAYITNDSTASPMVGPDGDVYIGVLENPDKPPIRTIDRGWLLHFSGDLSQTKTPGAFGWDDTPSVVPASMVPSYHGTSTYLLMAKYNNYAGVGTGNGLNQIAILDPNDETETDPVTGTTVMNPVLSILGQTPDPDYDQTYPGAVDEWCINSAAVDPATDSILAGNEDGKLYRWNLTSDTFTQVTTLTTGIGEAYTPTLIGPDGMVYAINNATLFAVGDATAASLTVTGLPSAVTAGTPYKLTVTVYNDEGDVDSAYAGTVSFTSSDPQADLPSNFTFTAADHGTYTLSVTLKTAGSQSITATDTATTTITGTLSGIRVSPVGLQQVNLASSYNRNGIVTDGSTFSGTGGLDGGGAALSANLLGTSQTWMGTTFAIGPAGSSDVTSAAGQTIALPAGQDVSLDLLATGVDGDQPNLTFTMQYSDGTKATFTQSVSDWFTPQNYSGESNAVTMAYRDLSNGTEDNRTFYLYGYTFALNSAKTVSSLTLPNDANVELVAATLVPVPSAPSVSLSGAFNRTGIYANGSSFSSTGGLDGGGAALSASLLGTSQTWMGITFAIGPAGSSDVVSATGQTIALPAGQDASLALLATGVDGNQPNLTFTVQYSDGTTATYTQSVSDWFAPQNYSGESEAVTMAYRDLSNGTKDNRTFFLYGYTFALNSAKTVSSLTLPNDADVELVAATLVPAQSATSVSLSAHSIGPGSTPTVRPSPAASTAAARPSPPTCSGRARRGWARPSRSAPPGRATSSAPRDRLSPCPRARMPRSPCWRPASTATSPT